MPTNSMLNDLGPTRSAWFMLGIRGYGNFCATDIPMFALFPGGARFVEKPFPRDIKLAHASSCTEESARDKVRARYAD